MTKITIKTKSGKMIERNANVTDWIDGNGRQSSTAQIGNAVYRVIDRTSDGAIFAAKWAW